MNRGFLNLIQRLFVRFFLHIYTVLWPWLWVVFDNNTFSVKVYASNQALVSFDEGEFLAELRTDTVVRSNGVDGLV